jgi:hypothetical protein
MIEKEQQVRPPLSEHALTDMRLTLSGSSRKPWCWCRIRLAALYAEELDAGECPRAVMGH